MLGILRATLVAVFFLSSPVFAQDQVAVSEAEWRSALTGVAETEEARRRVATEMSSDATRLLRSGDRNGGIRKTLMGLLLSRHVASQFPDRGNPSWERNVAALDELQNALVDSGVSISLIEASAENLARVLGAAAPKPKAKPRLATAAERREMVALVSKHLIDPTSPIFGEAHVVADQACMTVNAKNRFGGYVGNREAVFNYDRGSGKWTGGALINWPHGVCLDTIE